MTRPNFLLPDSGAMHPEAGNRAVQHGTTRLERPRGGDLNMVIGAWLAGMGVWLAGMAVLATCF